MRLQLLDPDASHQPDWWWFAFDVRMDALWVRVFGADEDDEDDDQ